MSKPKVRPIETAYRGRKFRSRLEARWAVYFDALDIGWEYEMEGFDLGGDLGYYLPDFYLPQVDMLAEVKPKAPTFLEEKKCKALALGINKPVLVLDGSPETKNYWAVQPDGYSGQEIIWRDYILAGRPYWLTEKRFFCCTGDIYPHRTQHNELFAMEACVEACSARFEKGFVQGSLMAEYLRKIAERTA